MHFSTSTIGFLLSALAAAAAAFETSSKRGLVYVTTTHPYDLQIFVGADGYSDLTWYYNYASTPSSAYYNLTQSQFEFVPMLFTADNTFLSTVKTLISGGRNITHVLAFNEPDGTYASGGSSLDPQLAATTWISQIVPLRKMGIKAGAPAVTGSQSGFTWLAQFFAACTAAGTNCTADFIPIHWYGDFEGMASHLGQVAATYPNTSIWVTEYAYNNASLADSQSFFTSSAYYFDGLDYVDRYSYFGSFRSSESNVGPNGAMLDAYGRLTDIGSWYLGGASTGFIPTASSAVKMLGPGAMWITLIAASFHFL